MSAHPDERAADIGDRVVNLLYGQPLKTFWLRLGNAPTSTIAVVLRQRELVMRHFNEDPHAAILRLA